MLAVSCVLGLLAVGCEESDATKKPQVQLQTERQALSVRDLTLENQKLADQNKKLAADLEATKKTLEAQRAELEAVKKDKAAADLAVISLKARVADLEKEKARQGKLLEESLENYNRMSKELEGMKKSPAPATQGPDKSAPVKTPAGK